MPTTNELAIELARIHHASAHLKQQVSLSKAQNDTFFKKPPFSFRRLFERVKTFFLDAFSFPMDPLTHFALVRPQTSPIKPLLLPQAIAIKESPFLREHNPALRNSLSSDSDHKFYDPLFARPQKSLRAQNTSPEKTPGAFSALRLFKISLLSRFHARKTADSASFPKYLP